MFRFGAAFNPLGLPNPNDTLEVVIRRDVSFQASVKRVGRRLKKNFVSRRLSD
jgi:hypothetical protein